MTLLSFILVVSLLSYRAATYLNVPGSPDEEHWVLQDFRDAIYYPAVAFLEGNNPYDAVSYRTKYPVGQMFPPYSPLTLLVHAPFVLLPFQSAELLYYFLTIVLMLLLACATLQMCNLPITAGGMFGFATLALLSRPGHWNLLLGQCTAQVVIGAYVALYFARRRPWLAGLGVALTTLKPTFGLPLAALMIAQRDVRPALIGLVIGGVLGGMAGMVIVHTSGGLSAFIDVLRASYLSFQAQSFTSAAESPIRLDAVALVGRLLGSSPGIVWQVVIAGAILSASAYALRRAARLKAIGNVRRLSAGLLCLTILIVTYHQSYNLLLLALPLTALVTNRWAPAELQTPVLRWPLICLLTLPSINYLASFRGLTSLGLTRNWWLVVTSLNGAALILAFLLYLALTLRSAPTAR